MSLDWTRQDAILFINSSLLQLNGLRRGYLALNGKTVRQSTSIRWLKRCKISCSSCVTCRLHSRSWIFWYATVICCCAM